MLYLTIHSTQSRLYGVGHMVKNHSDGENENPLVPPLHGLLFSISSKGYFICALSQTGKHTTARTGFRHVEAPGQRSVVEL